MLPTTCVVVPTYWTRAGGQPRPGDAVYDHPTAVDGHSTLPALLQSLETLDTSSFYLLILVAVAGRDVDSAAEARVAGMVEEHASLTTVIFGPSQLRRLHRWLSDRSLSDATSFLDLQTYPKIRNLQLAIPLALGCERIVALDDDEIVTDPDFLTKAVEPLGQTLDGVRIDGLSGHYLQENGSILLRVDPNVSGTGNIFQRKAAIMNAATEKLEREPGNIVPTPFCFGGNMEFTAHLAASVGFDPGITRGEDIDYLINARLGGRSFFLRKDLRILHCPPKGGSYKDASRSKLEQDVIRFMYEREKILAAQRRSDLSTLEFEDLAPYPGDFLADGIERDALAALEEIGHPDGAAFVEKVRSENPARVERYMEFRTRWPEVMQRMSGQPSIAEHLQPPARR